MAIAYKSIGTATATGTGSAIFNYPAGISAGDMIVMGVVDKYPPRYPTTFTGFTELTNGRGTGGAGASGTDSGTVVTSTFYRVATGTESGKGTVTVTSANSSGANVIVFSKTSAQYDWSTPVAVYGVDSTRGTGWVTVMGSAIDVVAGDMVVAVSGVNADAQTYSAELLAMGGITGWGAHTERADTAITGGNDCRLVISHHNATAGTANTAGTFTMTANGTLAAGVTVLVRLREYWARGTADGAEATQSQTMDEAVATYDGPLPPIEINPAEATQAQLMDAGIGVGIYPFAPAEATQSQTGDGASGVGMYVISAAESSQTQAMDTPAVSYEAPSSIPNVTPEDSTQSQVGDAATGYGIYRITCAESTQSQTGDAATTKSICVVTPAESTQSQLMDYPITSAIYKLTSAEGAQSQTGDEPSALFIAPTYYATPQKGDQLQSMEWPGVGVVYLIELDTGIHSQVMDMAQISIPLIPPSGIGSRETIAYRIGNTVFADASVIVTPENAAPLSSGEHESIEISHNRRITANRG